MSIEWTIHTEFIVTDDIFWHECPTCGYVERRGAWNWLRWGNSLVCSFECMKIDEAAGEEKT